MMITRRRASVLAAALVCSLFAADPAEAFRCGSKLVVEGMHEQQVVAICGQPAARRHLGYAVRPYDLRRRHEPGRDWRRGYPQGFGSLTEEVVIIEYIYNFGPRKLMQRLIFEGSILVEIEPIGYGYRQRVEKSSAGVLYGCEPAQNAHVCA